MKCALKILSDAMGLVVQTLVSVKSIVVGQNVALKSLQKIALKAWEEFGSKTLSKIIGPPNSLILKYMIVVFRTKINTLSYFSRNMLFMNYDGLLKTITYLIGNGFSSNETSQNPDDPVIGNQNFIALSLSIVLDYIKLIVRHFRNLLIISFLFCRR